MKYYIINIKITEEKRLIMTVESFSYLPEDALKIRIKVFVDEQGFIDEVDEIDSTATHLLLKDDNGSPIGTLRIFKGNAGDVFFIGRLCIIKEFRGRGYGALLLREAEKLVRSIDGKAISLHSQLQAKDFYEKSGYHQSGCLEYEQGQPHIWMKKEL